MEKQHIIRQFDNELNEIRSKLLEMGGKAEVMINDALQSLLDRDSDLADRVIAYDHEINRLEMDIDEKCLETIARYQPTARDLRFLTLSLKIVTDLERIGDQCCNFCRRAKELNELPPLKPFIDLSRMAHWATVMVKESLDAFVVNDVELAMKVCKDDAFVDDLNEQIQRELLSFMLEDNGTITRAIKIMNISKCIERIADHATNIAEMLIFMVKGKDIRHMAEIDKI